jgi:probable HAF family extracellular repeat protein
MSAPRRQSRWLHSVVALALAAALSAALAGASSSGRAAAAGLPFVAVDLGTLGGTSSVATAINGLGQVAGISTTAGGAVHAFVWDPLNGMQDVGSLGGRVLEVSGISNGGQVVGSGFTASNVLDAFSWTPAGGLVDIPSPAGEQNHAYAVGDSGQVLVTTGGGGGGLWTAASGIVPVANAPGTATFTKFFPETMNGSGQIVGFGYTADDPAYYHAFSWTPSAGAADLGRSGVFSVARAAADTGEVVGWESAQGVSTAWAWKQANGFTGLAFPEPMAVNVAGQVVGSDGNHLFFHDPARGTEDLGTLGGATASVPTFTGFAYYHLLNRNGQVVGRSETAPYAQHAFSWTHAGGMVDLGTLGGAASTAYAVNDRGQVVGSAELADGTSHAVVWAPQTPPANDAFAASDPIWIGLATNRLATKEPGEPDHAGNLGGASVWYGIPARQQATATWVSIDDSSFDTTLAVYTGSSVDALTLVAANDDATIDGTNSKVCFVAQPNTFYYVAVDGYDADTGDFRLLSGRNPGLDPCPTLPPEVSGTPVVGGTLTSTAGVFYGSQLPVPDYQWYACSATSCNPIAGATSPTFTPTAVQVGLRLGIVVTARHGADATQDASSNSPLTSAVLPAPPGAPTGVGATAGDGSATVSFSAPAADGGGAITGYTVTASPGGATAHGASSPIVVGGLANGTTYTFTVAATNAGGTGPASAPSSAVTPTAPAPPPPPGGGGGGVGADLAVEATVAPATAIHGDTLTWTFRVTDVNRGPAVDAHLDLELSSNLAYVSSTTTRGPGCVQSGAKVHCFLDWMSGDALTATVTVVTTVVADGDYSVKATVGQLIPDSKPEDNTVTVKASVPPAPPPPPLPAAPVRPVIAAAKLTPARAVGGKRLVVTFAVTRSDNGRPLTRGKLICDPSVAGKMIAHVESFANGRARLAFTIPKSAKGKLLKVRVTIKAGTATTRVATVRVH